MPMVNRPTNRATSSSSGPLLRTTTECHRRLGIVTRRPPARLDLLEFGNLCRATLILSRVGASRVKRTTRRWVPRTRHFAAERNSFALRRRIGNGDGG